MNRPVKLTLDRAEDMTYCPGRSPAQARYRAGFDTNGRIRALDIDFYLSGGFSNDYSADIAETATPPDGQRVPDREYPGERHMPQDELRFGYSRPGVW